MEECARKPISKADTLNEEVGVFGYHCPACKSSLPGRDLLLTGSTKCPGCAREIEPRRWTVFVTVLAVILVAQLLREFVLTGLSLFWGITLVTVIALAVGLGLLILGSRYLRVKPSRTSVLHLGG